MTLRVLIADDEALSRERLRRFLREEPQVEIVAECVTGPETLCTIREASPELVFLDVKMPEMDGFSLLQQLNGTRLPVIIFVTASDRFAVRAFDVHAVDYLLKPFDRDRFRTAFSRALERLHALASGTATASSGIPERLAVKSQGRISLISLAEIDSIRAADNYVALQVGKATHLLRTTLTDLETQLPRERFLRISRSHLVNVERVREIRSKSHGDALAVLHDGTTLPVSRNYRRRLRVLAERFR